LRDSLEMEWAGIPSVAIVHEALAGSANSMRVISKMPDYPVLEVRFPLPPVGVWTPEEIDALCTELLPKIVDQLTKPLPGSSA
jgi:hypothetical protein